MKTRTAASAILPLFGLAMLAGLAIICSEGIRGLKPFFNIEAILLVVLGTLPCLWIAYPMQDIFQALKAAVSGKAAAEADAQRYSALLRAAADTSLGLGALVSLFGMILMLSSIEDASAVPRRLALLLSAIFYGLCLSEIIFMPLSRRILNSHQHAGTSDPVGHRGRSLLIAFLAAGTILSSTMTVLYALERDLSAAVLKK